jgi:hypothetical protein
MDVGSGMRIVGPCNQPSDPKVRGGLGGVSLVKWPSLDLRRGPTPAVGLAAILIAGAPGVTVTGGVVDQPVAVVVLAVRARLDRGELKVHDDLARPVEGDAAGRIS